MNKTQAGFDDHELHNMMTFLIAKYTLHAVPPGQALNPPAYVDAITFTIPDAARFPSLTK